MSETPISNPFDEDEKAGRRPILWAVLGIAVACCGAVFVGALFYFQPDAKSLYAQYFPSTISYVVRENSPSLVSSSHS